LAGTKGNNKMFKQCNIKFKDGSQMSTWLPVNIAKEGNEIKIDDKFLKINKNATILKVYHGIVIGEKGIRINEKQKFPSLK